MFNIFSVNSKKSGFLEEGEPPPKKTTNEDLIKNLSKKQLQTKTSLIEQLYNTKEFEKSEEYTSLTKLNAGTSKLDEFQRSLSNLKQVNELKNKGLSEEDIKLFNDYKKGVEYFRTEYKNVDQSVLQDRLNYILQIVESDVYEETLSAPKSISRSDKDYLNSYKPDSKETKLLKFALDNKVEKEILPHPIDELPELETQFMKFVANSTPCDIKKIRKKARSISNKISNLVEENKLINESKVKLNSASYVKKSLWDIKEKQETQPKPLVINKNKKYSCEEQTFYTIKDGKIVKLDRDNKLPDKTIKQNDEKLKISVEEIKQSPKFHNYEVGEPTSTLFLKNLSKHISEEYLRSLIKSSDTVSIKIMKGKMRGQAFMEFQSINDAIEALNNINGIIFRDKPIIVQYGKKKENINYLYQ